MGVIWLIHVFDKIQFQASILHSYNPLYSHLTDLHVNVAEILASNNLVKLKCPLNVCISELLQLRMSQTLTRSVYWWIQLSHSTERDMT